MMDAGVLSYESSLLSFIDATIPAPEAAMGVQQLMLQLFFPLQLYRLAVAAIAHNYNIMRTYYISVVLFCSITI